MDLECKLLSAASGREYIDIGCSFPKHKASCAIELKFKTAKQGAQDHGRIDAYQDIEALERALGVFSFGRFYMITDSSVYVNESRRGVGKVFATHDENQTNAGATFNCPNSVGRQDVKLTLKNSYTFQWEQIDKWYFLELHIP